MRWVLDPALSPDGQQVAYVLKRVHPDDPEERYVYQLACLDVNEPPTNGVGRQVLPLFDGTVRVPRWDPSGERIAFLSNKSGANQVWLFDWAAGVLARLTDAARGVTSFEWSPDGTHLVFVANVFDNTGEHGESVPGRYRVIRRLGYKTDGVGYWNECWSQAFITRTDGSSSPSAGTQLTTEPFGVSNAAWSPDGSAIAYISSGAQSPDTTAVRNIYVASNDMSGDSPGRAESRQLTQDLAVQSMSWSPSGAEIAFLADDLSDDRATNLGVWVSRIRDGAVVNLTADIDRPAGDYVTDDMNAEAGGAVPEWSADGREILAIMSDRGRSIVVSISFPGDQAFSMGVARSYADTMLSDPWAGSMFNVRPHGHGDHRVFAMAYGGTSQVVVARSDASGPGDLIHLTISEEGEVTESRLTNVNESLLATRRISRPEPVAFSGSENRRIEGWLLTPSNGAVAPYPLVLHIHGGPHSAYSVAFNFELQHLAAQGYAVLYVNPHGSHTYGRAVNIGTRCDWGGKDYDDLMLAVDHVLSRGDIDRERLGVAGGSYGGWMTNYIVTRTTRFRAAVAQRSSSNRTSTMLSSMVGYKHQRWEAPGAPWKAPDYFMKVSPVMHADKVETPLLLEHSEDDHLCPLMQAEEMFTALKMQGKTVELIYFFDESHYLLRGGRTANRVERLNRIADWFDRYV